MAPNSIFTKKCKRYFSSHQILCILNYTSGEKTYPLKYSLGRIYGEEGTLLGVRDLE